MSEPAVDWETVSRTELNALRRENAALKAHVDRLESELKERDTPSFLESVGAFVVVLASLSVSIIVVLWLWRLFFE